MVPSSFTASHWVCLAGMPAKVCHVIVDVPRTPANGVPHPVVTRSCGDPGVDAVGQEYVSSILSGSGNLLAQNQRNPLGFQLKIRPCALALPPLKPRPRVRPDTTLTRHPPYPLAARREHAVGVCCPGDLSRNGGQTFRSYFIPRYNVQGPQLEHRAIYSIQLGRSCPTSRATLCLNPDLGI